MLVSNEIKHAEKKKVQAGKKKYAKVDAETQTQTDETSNKLITSFFSADEKNEKKKELAANGPSDPKDPRVLKARPLMINLDCL